MGDFRSFIRRIKQDVFGVRYVELVMFDGERRVSDTWWVGPRLLAGAHDSHTIGTCILLDGGKVYGPSYVKSWEPLDYGAARVWPSPAREAA